MLLLLSLLYLAVKSDKSFVKIGYSDPPPPSPAYLILPNFSTPRLLGPPFIQDPRKKENTAILPL